MGPKWSLASRPRSHQTPPKVLTSSSSTWITSELISFYSCRELHGVQSGTSSLLLPRLTEILLFPSLVCWGQRRAAALLLVSDATIHLLVLLLRSLLLCFGPEPQPVALKQNKNALVLLEITKLKKSFNFSACVFLNFCVFFFSNSILLHKKNCLSALSCMFPH